MEATTRRIHSLDKSGGQDVQGLDCIGLMMSDLGLEEFYGTVTNTVDPAP